MIHTQTDWTIQQYRSDNREEFKFTKLKAWVKSQGVIWEFTALYTPEQDDVSEWEMCTI